ncbi:MAG: DUF3598 family protein [Lysobacterales bacterium]
MALKDSMPVLIRHEGVWEGFYRYLDIHGKPVGEHKSRLLCRFPTEDTYHQTNNYFWEDGRTEVRDFPTRIENGKLIFYTEITGWAAEVPLDEHNRTVMLHWTRNDDSSLYLYEMIQISDCGTYRSRVWQWFRNGQLEQRTLIDERRVSNDWAAYEKSSDTYKDIATFF